MRQLRRRGAFARSGGSAPRRLWRTAGDRSVRERADGALCSFPSGGRHRSVPAFREEQREGEGETASRACLGGRGRPGAASRSTRRRGRRRRGDVPGVDRPGRRHGGRRSRRRWLVGSRLGVGRAHTVHDRVRPGTSGSRRRRHRPMAGGDGRRRGRWASDGADGRGARSLPCARHHGATSPQPGRPVLRRW